MMKAKEQAALARAVKFFGSRAALARALKITPSAITQWKQVPCERAIEIEKLTKAFVRRAELRPDLFN